MRHCSGERVQVFESVNQSLPALLREAANEVEEQGETYTNLNLQYTDEGVYELTLYVH